MFADIIIATNRCDVPNTTRSGNPSNATTASRQPLRVSIEGYNLTGQACIIIALPGED